jgi:hypothetical protein
MAAIVLAALLVGSQAVYREIAREASCRSQWGNGWEAEYEKEYGSLTDARSKIAVSALGLTAICCLVVKAGREVQSGNRSRPPHRGTAQHGEERELSRRERVYRLRRKALLWILLGLGGLFAGVAVVLLGLVIFVSGYAGVITGCSWWLKANGWNDAVVFIGLWPLAVFFIPFLRLIFIAEPLILAAALFFMALILIAVIFNLADRSGVPRRRVRREHGRIQ